MERQLPGLLNQLGVWKEVESATARYLLDFDKKGPEFAIASLILKFTYSYLDLALTSEELLDCIIMEPCYYQHMLRKIILEAVNLNLKERARPIQVKIEQIHCVQRFEGLPKNPRYQFWPTMKQSLSNFNCVVTGRSDVKMYIRQTVWYCEFKCPYNVIAGDLLQLDSKMKVPKCIECQTSMKEYVKLRDMPEYVMLHTLPLQSVQTPRSIGKVYEKFRILLTDELTQAEVILGNAYTVTGAYDGIQKIFVAWHIDELKDV